MVAALAVFIITERPVEAASVQPGVVTRALVWCGQRCYSLYLLHLPILGLAFLATGALDTTADTFQRVALAIVAAGLTFGAADLAFRFVEQPFMALAETLAPYNAMRLSTERVALSRGAMLRLDG